METTHTTPDELQQAHDRILEKLGDALELHDPATGQHSKRVVAFTVVLARAMGLDDQVVQVIARGASLHDIGKTEVPATTLRKPTLLTAEEMATMREHCYRGYQIALKHDFLTAAAEIVYAHHERWDGAGYPRSLKGADIPLGARIVAVANTLDAIMADLPYRAGRGYSVAQEEIVRESGKQFDPDVVRVLGAIPEPVWCDIRQEIDSQVYRRISGS